MIMTGLQVLQIAVGWVAALTPWLVVRVALGVAARHASALGVSLQTPPAVAHLTRATALVAPFVIVAGFVLAPPSLLMGFVDLGAFALLAGFGLRALGAIDAASWPLRDVEAAERTASLRPRRLRDYLPFAIRFVPFVVTTAGMAALAWRLSTSSANRLLVPVAFILAAPVFLWLYEIWMRSEIAGDPSIGDNRHDADARRRTRVRHIMILEIVLVAGLVGAGHALLGANWAQQSLRVISATVIGSVLGVIGCAFALSSDLSRRRYREAGSSHG